MKYETVVLTVLIENISRNNERQKRSSWQKRRKKHQKNVFSSLVDILLEKDKIPFEERIGHSV